MSGEFPAGTTITDGSLNLNSDGTIVPSGNGGEIYQNGALIPLTIIEGAMDINRSMFTVLVENSNGQQKEMLTAVKVGSGFQQSDLTGKWYMYGVTAFPPYTSVVGRGSTVIADNGEMSSGSLNLTFNNSPTPSTFTLTGKITINDDGSLSGGPDSMFNSQTYELIKNDLRQMSLLKDIIVIRSSDGSGNNAYNEKHFLFKEGGTFSTADLNGRWYFEAINNNTADA